MYLTEQDGAAGPKKWMGSIAGTLGLKENKRDEFEHVREYLPVRRDLAKITLRSPQDHAQSSRDNFIR